MEILYTLPSGETASIHVDAVVKETPSTSAEVTTDPVENGIAITDHVIPNPDTLEIEGFVSNEPIDVPKTHLFGVTGEVVAVEVPRPKSPVLYGLLDAGGGADTASVLQFSGPFDRRRSVYEELRRLVREGVPVKIVTGFREYESFALQDFRVNREASTGSALAFSITATEVVIVETQIVKVPTAERRGQKKESRGVQAPKEEKKTSLLKKIVTAVTGG